MKKTCRVCKKDLPLEMFNKKRSNKDGRQRRCKECDKSYQKEWYSKNKKRRMATVVSRRLKIAKVIRELKNEAPCADCTKKYPFYVMDFDHVRGDKEFLISKAYLIGRSLERLQEEIDKCDIVCSNCHRERTFQRTQS